MRILIIIITLLSFNCMTAQELKTHQWKNRLLLVLSENENSEDYKNQITRLQQAGEDLTERKLIVYHILPNKYKLSTNDKKWIKSSALYKKYMRSKSTFKVILIGLDGTLKLEEVKVVETEKLFELIDAMPMRQSAIRQN